MFLLETKVFFMKKIFLYGMLLVVMCCMSGCGNSDKENELKSVEERAIELQKDAKEAADKANESTKRLGEDAKKLEEQ